MSLQQKKNAVSTKEVKYRLPMHMPAKSQVVIPTDNRRRPHSSIRKEGLQLECRKPISCHSHWTLQKCSLLGRKVYFSLQKAQANGLFITK